MTRRRKIITLVLAFVIIIGGIFFAGRFIHRSIHSKQYISSTTPTLFVHGWGSSYRAERQMVNYAKNEGVSNTVVRADVAKSGHVSWHGSIPRGARNPIIEVNLLDNKSITSAKDNNAKGYQHVSRYVTDVVLAMQKKYHFQKMNLVGHSMGNMQIAYYILDHGNDPHMPTLEKQVSIAGHYNGLNAIGNAKHYKIISQSLGKPNHMVSEYKGLLKLRHNYPQTAKVLNIYGDLKDGSHSDGQVPVNSAKSYKYLVKPRAKSYHELEITGRMGQHSKLHENKQVDRALVNFLWKK
ncbi:alpha/beta hydrolase [Limosilactobacillus sp.]|uniref:alpha/beta hydrolase n=1 Tax=Limosilactobacillus sp. TaxID=2773925 RepID=UPI00345ECE04